MPSRGDEGCFLRCLRPLDERVNVKLLLRVWGKRFETFVRLLLVATFLDDAIRCGTHFSEHVKLVGEEGYLKAFMEATSKEIFDVIAAAALGIGLLVQSIGSLCLLAQCQADGAAKALIVWAVAQPVLYAQLANVEFVTESLSLVGGLLILRAHLSEQEKAANRRIPLGGGALCAPDGGNEASIIARTQLLGRLLLPAVYLYHALTLLVHLARGHHSFSMFVVNLAVLGCLVLGCALVAVGLKSRTVALSLALVNLFVVLYRHPFFLYVWRENGAWKYDEDKLRISMPHVALPKDVMRYAKDPDDFEPWYLVDLHRYYFFQGLSTSGALLLLAQFGPGEIAIEEDEVLLGDVQRARDYRAVPVSAA